MKLLIKNGNVIAPINNINSKLNVVIENGTLEVINKLGNIILNAGFGSNPILIK